jgi:hypothetical protein
MNRLTFLSAVSNSAVASGRSSVAFIMTVVLGLAFAGAAMAQTTTTVDVRHFEVISVDGNTLVVRDERGTNEYTVPADFRFTVDGKKMSASELKPGMKGTATVTTTTTIKPVFVTEIKEGVVLKVVPGLVEIRDSQRVQRRFTQDQLDQRGVEIIKDGQVMRISQLKEGDMLTATIVSKAEPVVVTEKDVQATTAPGNAEPKAESKAESAPMQVAKADATQPAAAPPSAAPQPPAVQPPPPPSESSGLGTMWWVLIIVVLAVIVFAMMRRKKQT